MLKKVYEAEVFGVEVSTVTVEVNLDKGIRNYLAGLPDMLLKRLTTVLQVFYQFHLRFFHNYNVYF